MVFDFVRERDLVPLSWLTVQRRCWVASAGSNFDKCAGPYHRLPTGNFYNEVTQWVRPSLTCSWLCAVYNLLRAPASHKHNVDWIRHRAHVKRGGAGRVKYEQHTFIRRKLWSLLQSNPMLVGCLSNPAKEVAFPNLNRSARTCAPAAKLRHCGR